MKEDGKPMPRTVRDDSMTLPRTVCDDGMTLPRLGLGTWEMGDVPAQRAEEIAALRAGLDLGLTMIKADYFLRGLRGDPRFGALLAKMKLPQ